MRDKPGEIELGKLISVISDAIAPLQLDDDDHMSAVSMAVAPLLGGGEMTTVRGTDYPLFRIELEPDPDPHGGVGL